MLLVSACLAGETVRYDGGHCLKEEIEQRVQEKEARIFCPEVAGGLSTPREPAEIQGGDGYDVLDGTATVQTISGKDVTEAFLSGAQAMLAFAQHQQATCIVLKEDSPSCGSQSIHLKSARIPHFNRVKGDSSTISGGGIAVRYGSI